MRVQAFWLLILLIVIGCDPADKDSNEISGNRNTSGSDEPVLFEDVPAEQSGISFENLYFESDTLNYTSYGYLYSGGGVGVIDFDNDGLPDIVFSSTMGENALYRNIGGGKFEDVSDKAGISGNDALATGVSIVDINEDGWDDIFICNSGPWSGSRISNTIFINQKDGSFKDETVQRGLDDQSHTSQALFVDIDNDGDQDLFLANHPVEFTKTNTLNVVQKETGEIVRKTGATVYAESDRIYLNTGNGNFRDISEKAGVLNNAYGLSAVTLDVNNDGLPDIYVSNDFIEPDLLYINQGNQTFKDEHSKYFRHMAHNSMGTDIGDINNDGLEDIIVVDMLPEPRERRYQQETNMRLDRHLTLMQYGYQKQVMKNVLQVNLGSAGFAEIGEFSGVAATDWSWGPIFNDFDNDGLKDLFISNGFRRDYTDNDYIRYINENYPSGSAKGLTFEELYKIIPEQKISNYMYRNAGGFKFDNVTAAWNLDKPTFSNGVAIADFDMDGDVDIIVNNADHVASYYKNLTSDKTDSHFLRVKLNGPKGNRHGQNAKVEIRYSGKKQIGVMRSTRGFFASSEPIVHFGLGSLTSIDTLILTWPDGKGQVFSDLSVDSIYTFDYSSAGKLDLSVKSSPSIFSKAVSPPFSHAHNENDFLDVKRELLIPRPFSRKGPCIVEGDLNGDGLQDIFIGGGRTQAGAVYLQNRDGKFSKMASPVLEKDKDYEDVDAVIADFNGDGLNDLYVGSGGSSELENSFLYHDRLYLGAPGGKFTVGELPKNVESTGAVAASDIDNDGDIDLFIGIYIRPNSYPKSGQSYLLRNNGGKFEIDASLDLGEEMVSDAAFADVNGDGQEDLIVLGEWMAPTVLINNKGLFSPASGNGLAAYTGWWNCLKAIDIDGDGDVDFVAGNYGENSRFQASNEEPLSVLAADFDQNGKFDAILTQYFRGEVYPVPRRDEMLAQMPSLKKKFTSFASYSSAKLEDVIGAEASADALRKSANTLRSTVFINDGKGNFKGISLPSEAQFFPVFAIEALDADGDGDLDLVLGGNDLFAQVETASIDAGMGWLFLQESDGNFEGVNPVQSGIQVDGEIRSIRHINTAGGSYLLFGRSNAPLVWLSGGKVSPEL